MTRAVRRPSSRCADQLRRLRYLTLPADLVEPLTAALPPRTVIDGEIIVWDSERGRCDFSRLQRRLVAGRALQRHVRRPPAHMVAFDLLRDARGPELLNQPLSRRRNALERLLAGAPTQIAVCPRTTSRAVAQQWMSQTAVAGIEGVVAKPLHGRYQPGRAGWTKTRNPHDRGVHRRRCHRDPGPADFAAARSPRFGRSAALPRANSSITADHRNELTGVLRGMTFRGDGSGHPWPCPLPPSWSVGMPGTPELTYVPVEPVVVAEVQVDTALDGAWGKIRHRCRYVRARLDLRPADLLMTGSDRSVTHEPAAPLLLTDDLAAST